MSAMHRTMYNERGGMSSLFCVNLLLRFIITNVFSLYIMFDHLSYPVSLFRLWMFLRVEKERRKPFFCFLVFHCNAVQRRLSLMSVLDCYCRVSTMMHFTVIWA